MPRTELDDFLGLEWDETSECVDVMQQLRAQKYHKLHKDKPEYKARRNKNQKAFYQRNIKGKPESNAAKNARLKYRFGLTIVEWNSIFVKQNSSCAICNSVTPNGKNWHTDHCHRTGKIRGILCGHCNHMLGYARDNKVTLIAAARYLEVNE